MPLTAPSNVHMGQQPMGMQPQMQQPVGMQPQMQQPMGMQPQMQQPMGMQQQMPMHQMQAPPPSYPGQTPTFVNNNSTTVVSMGGGVMVPPPERISVSGHIVFACFVFWCCGWVFGLIAFILACKFNVTIIYFHLT